jgi:hypothetical protein
MVMKTFRRTTRMTKLICNLAQDEDPLDKRVEPYVMVFHIHLSRYQDIGTAFSS